MVNQRIKKLYKLRTSLLLAVVCAEKVDLFSCDMETLMRFIKSGQFHEWEKEVLDLVARIPQERKEEHLLVMFFMILGNCSSQESTNNLMKLNRSIGIGKKIADYYKLHQNDLCEKCDEEKWRTFELESGKKCCAICLPNTKIQEIANEGIENGD